MKNAILDQFKELPYDAPAFDKYTGDIYKQAFNLAFKRAKERQEALANSSEEPTFANTIAELEYIQQIINDVREPFALSAFDSRPEIVDVEETIAEPLERFYSNLYQDEKIWSRVKEVIENKEQEDLSPDSLWLLIQYERKFIRSGINLSPENKKLVQDLSANISKNMIKFSGNVREDTKIPYIIEGKDTYLLEGLDDQTITEAKELAHSHGRDGYAFIPNMPNTEALLTSSNSSEFREQIWHAFYYRGNSGPYDNHQLMKEILIDRAKIAETMGYKSWSAYMLEPEMIGTPEKAMELMTLVWEKLRLKMEAQTERLQQEKGDGVLLPADWLHFSKVVKEKDFNFNEDDMKEYLPYNNVRKGLFETVHKIFGLDFYQRFNLPVFADKTATFLVREGKKDVGLFYVDDFQRPNKNGGAWMENGRISSGFFADDNRIPIIANALNVKPAEGENYDKVNVDMQVVITAFHELGHGLHGLLSKAHYPSQAGTNTPTDFVELPSQLLERWSTTPSVLKTFAINDKGETIPDDLLAKWKSVEQFTGVYDRASYIISAFQDMKLHSLSLEETKALDFDKFTEELNKELKCPPVLKARYNLTHFNHIFGGDYASKYYAYLYSAVLDADVFSNVEKHGLFNKKNNQKLRDEIYSRGHSRPVLESFKAFMGREPDVTALLRADGLLDETQDVKKTKKSKNTP